MGIFSDLQIDITQEELNFSSLSKDLFLLSTAQKKQKPTTVEALQIALVAQTTAN